MKFFLILALALGLIAAKSARYKQPSKVTAIPPVQIDPHAIAPSDQPSKEATIPAVKIDPLATTPSAQPSKEATIPTEKNDPHAITPINQSSEEAKIPAIQIKSHEHDKVVCFWNSTSSERAEPAKFEIGDLITALPLCTHLIYGFAGIHPRTFEVVSLNPFLDTGTGYAYYALTTQLKQDFPHLKIYLSIGGNADPFDETFKYLKLTEKHEYRTKFINSVLRILADYNFDGIDLAWQFPTVPVKKPTSSVWQRLKRSVGYGEFVDERNEEHRNGFSSLVIDLKAQLLPLNKALTLTVLPHVDSSIYYEAKHIHPKLDAIHIMAYNQRTPERNPKTDFIAATEGNDVEVFEDNVDSVTGHWTMHGTPSTKLVIGIPTFARTWKLNKNSMKNGIPVTADGPGAAGYRTDIPGLLSFPEVCSRLVESLVGTLKRADNSLSKYAGYAYHGGTDAEGIWVSYEDTVTAGNKAVYVKKNDLGGVAISDLSLDDFQGGCLGEAFPILRVAAYELQNPRIKAD